MTVARMWQEWISRKDLSFVPIKLFCGKASWEWFLDLQAKKSVDLVNTNPSSAIVLRDELNIGFLVVKSGLSEQEAIQYSKPSKNWLNRKKRPLKESCIIICALLGIRSDSLDYTKLRDLYRRRMQ